MGGHCCTSSSLEDNDHKIKLKQKMTLKHPLQRRQSQNALQQMKQRTIFRNIFHFKVKPKLTKVTHFPSPPKYDPKHPAGPRFDIQKNKIK